MKFNRYYRNYFIRKYLICPLVQIAFVISKKFLKEGKYYEDCVFIAGMSRSGSTFFTDSINRNNFFKWVEGPLLFEPYFYSRSIDHKNDLETFTEHAKLKFAVLFIKFLRKFFFQKNQQFLNKHPENTFRVAAIREYLPKSKIILTIREPVSVVASHLRKTKNDRFRHSYPNGQFPKQRNWRQFVDKDRLTQFTEQYIGFCKEIAKIYQKYDNVLIVDYDEIDGSTANIINQFVGKQLINDQYFKQYKRSTRAIDCLSENDKRFIWKRCQSDYKRVRNLSLKEFY